MAHLLVDGHNLLYTIEPDSVGDLQTRRERLLQKLHHYQVRKNTEITVIFDGSDRPGLMENRIKLGSMTITFSDSAKTADEAIRDLCEEHPGRYIVVSNGTEVQYFATIHQSIYMTSSELAERLKQIESSRATEENPFFEDKPEDTGPLYPRVSTKKKGAAKRLPKKDRKRIHHLRNL